MTELIHMPLSLRGGFHVLEEIHEPERIIAGYASIIEVDKQDHFIPKEALEDGMRSLLEDSDYANIMMTHKNVQIGKVIPEYSGVKTHVDDNGLFIVVKMRNNLDIANEVWEKILNNELNGFSIAAEVLKSRGECNDEKCWKVIEKMNIFEISVCHRPINSKSGFVVISKGEDLPDNVIEDVYKNVGNKMTEEKTSPSEVEKEVVIIEEDTATQKVTETTEKSEFNIEAAIDELKRQVSALTGIVMDMNKPPEPEVIEEITKKSDDECVDCEDKVKEIIKEEKVDDPLEAIKKSIDSILSRLDKEDKTGELSVAIKARDDKISALETKLNVIEKAGDEIVETKDEPKEDPKEDTPVEQKKDSEEKEHVEATKEDPKTLTNEESTEVKMQSPIIIKDGMVSANK